MKKYNARLMHLTPTNNNQKSDDLLKIRRIKNISPKNSQHEVLLMLAPFFSAVNKSIIPFTSLEISNSQRKKGGGIEPNRLSVYYRIRVMQHTLENTFRKQGVVFAYQFGSSISGTQRKDSDIDIAVMFKNDYSQKQRLAHRLDLIEQLLKEFANNVDLVVLNDLSSILFKFNIIKDGRRIYDSGQINLAEYESRIMSEYFDFQPTLKMFRTAYVKSKSRHNTIKA